jgi:hypothetical protein
MLVALSCATSQARQVSNEIVAAMVFRSQTEADGFAAIFSHVNEGYLGPVVRCFGSPDEVAMTSGDVVHSSLFIEPVE